MYDGMYWICYTFPYINNWSKLIEHDITMFLMHLHKIRQKKHK